MAEIELYGGSMRHFADSMADEIEKAYDAVLRETGKAGLPSSDIEGRRTLFIAIARGVINHLHQKQGAFEIDVPDESHLPRTVKPRIKVRAPIA